MEKYNPANHLFFLFVVVLHLSIFRYNELAEEVHDASDSSSSSDSDDGDDNCSIM